MLDLKISEERLASKAQLPEHLQLGKKIASTVDDIMLDKNQLAAAVKEALANNLNAAASGSKKSMTSTELQKLMCQHYIGGKGKLKKPSANAVRKGKVPPPAPSSTSTSTNGSGASAAASLPKVVKDETECTTDEYSGK